MSEFITNHSHCFYIQKKIQLYKYIISSNRTFVNNKDEISSLLFFSTQKNGETKHFCSVSPFVFSKSVCRQFNPTVRRFTSFLRKQEPRFFCFRKNIGTPTLFIRLTNTVAFAEKNTNFVDSCRRLFIIRHSDITLQNSNLG